MILTIDIGTSNFKAAVFDFEGNRLNFTSYPLKINGDCNQWIECFYKCFEYLVSSSLKLNAIVITGNGPTLVPVLDDDSVLNILYWFDRTAEKYQDKVSEVMGGFVDARFFLPKILKIKNEENDLYGRTKHFLGCPEYLAYCITGQAKSVFPLDGFDLWFWNDEALSKLGLDKQKFPLFIRPGDKFGNSNGIPVISGGPDFFSAILGAGVTEPGQALDRTGSSEGINLCACKRYNRSALMSYKHPIKPYWNLSGIISKSGLKIEEESKKNGFNNISEFLKSDKSKPVLEEICQSIKKIIAMLEESGETVKELRVTGGLSLDARLNQMKADLTGKRVIELENGQESELLGCAIIGSYALGKFNTYKDACDKMVKIKKIF